LRTANRFWTGIFVLILLYSLNLCAPVSAFDRQRVECPTCESSLIDNWEYPEGWELLWDPTNIEEIDSGCTAYISVIGGVSPYKWSVSGTGFSFSVGKTEERTNALYADDTACGSAAITVTDDFGDNVTGYVRCKNGQWVFVADGCIIPPGACSSIIYPCDADNKKYCCIYGKYFQVQHVSGTGYLQWGLCPGDCCQPHGPDSYCLEGSCDPVYGCDCCLVNGCCTNSGYAGSPCPPVCRRWCRCNTELYFMEWQCAP
jgi:hypothetical protein